MSGASWKVVQRKSSVSRVHWDQASCLWGEWMGGECGGWETSEEAVAMVQGDDRALDQGNGKGAEGKGQSRVI